MSSQTNAKPLLIVAAGGTGGHVFPAQALAEEMLDRGWRVKLWTDNRGLKFTDNFPDAAEIYEVKSATISRGNLFSKMISPIKLMIGIVTSFLRLRQQRPSVVAGFGGYPAFPPLLAAYIARVPRVIHEQNGVLGRANKLLSKRVNLVVCGASMTELPPNVKSITVGNPIREDILANSGTAYSIPERGDLKLLVIGGSQGASLMDEIIPQSVANLPETLRSRLKVVQQVRPQHQSTVERCYKELGITYSISNFFEDIAKKMVETHLIIARAGASTVAEIAAIGRPSILIPFAAAANNHQSANAAGLVAAGAAIVVSETDVSPERLATEMSNIFQNTAQANSMAQSARRIAMPHVAANFADIIESLVENRL